MALSGTLKDFGIPDILQLIGQQQKTGRLLLETANNEVEVWFSEGHVVFASETARKQQGLLGSLLLRAELLSPAQLEEALERQQRTLKRLGDVLTEMGAVTEQQLAQMTRLQTTETLYKLFSWKSGSYEFVQEEVDDERRSFEPIRAETVLLEGFRRLDEWPALRKKLPSSDATFTRERELDTRDLPPIDDGGLGLDDGDRDGKPTERHKLVYRLAVGGKNVRQVIDASRLGEFEAMKALNELVEWGFLKAVAPPSGAKAVAQGLRHGGQRLAQSGALVRAGLTLCFFLASLVLARFLLPTVGAAPAERPALQGAAARILARDQLVRLQSALELWRAEHGEYPRELGQLIEGQVVNDADLRYPYREPYHYRRTANGFVLLPPLD